MRRDVGIEGGKRVRGKEEEGNERGKEGGDRGRRMQRKEQGK